MGNASGKGYNDSHSSEEKLAWLSSPDGQAMLNKRPRLNALYKEGKLQQMVGHSEWEDKLSQWLTPGAGLRDGLAQGLRRVTGHGTQMPVEGLRCETIQNISEVSKRSLVVHGYFILADIIPRDIWLAARKYLNNRIGSGTKIADNQEMATAEGSRMQKLKINKLDSSHSHNVTLLRLMYGTPLASVLNSLLHGPGTIDNVYENIQKYGCQIALRFPELDEPPVHKKLGGHQWHIDGMDIGEVSPFTILVGIALSDQLETFMGNLCVFPGSHYKLHDLCNIIVAEKSSTETTKVVDNVYDLLIKPDLDEPVQILLKAGDVVVCHQKLAHRGGPNYSSEIRLMVYFRVSHKYHNILKDRTLENLWLEFDGLEDIKDCHH